MADGSNTGTVKKKKGRPKGSKSSYTVSQKALAQRRKNGAMPIPQTPEEYDFNSRMINHIMQVHEISAQADRNDLNSLKSCFINYLKLCQQNGFPVQNLAAYAAMGFFDLGSFNIFGRRSDPEIKAFVASVRSVCAMFREEMVTEGKLNPVIGIFWQRNFDGLRNDTEQIQSIKEQEEDSVTNTAYKEKYKNLIGGGGK